MRITSSILSRAFRRPFQNMGTFLCFIQIILCSSGNNILLMSQIIFRSLSGFNTFGSKASSLQEPDKHDNAKSILQLCMFIQLIQNYIGIGIFTKINTDTHTLTAGMVIQVCNSIDLFITDKLCDLSIRRALFTRYGKLGNDNT